MRHDGKVENRAVYTAIGINVEVLGGRANSHEGDAKQWLTALI